MIYLDRQEVINLHADLIRASGGAPGLKEPGLLDSAVAQPRMTFGGQDLYPTLIDKAAALAYSLAPNHAFVDGNKRIAQASMEAMLIFSGHEIIAPVGEQESVFLDLAAGRISRNDFIAWLGSRAVPIP